MLKPHKPQCTMTAWDAAYGRSAANGPKPPRPVCTCGADYENEVEENLRLRDALWSACTFIAHQGGTDPDEEFYGYLDAPPRKYGEPFEQQ